MSGRDYRLVRQVLGDRLLGVMQDVARYETEAFSDHETGEAVVLHETGRHLAAAVLELDVEQELQQRGGAA